MSDPSPLRVGLLIDRWEPDRGGAERALALLARHLEERGHQVLAFADRAAPDAPGTFRRVKAGSAWGGLRRAKFEHSLGHALVAAAREAQCDVTIGIRHLPAVDVFWPHGGSHAASLEARHRAEGEEVPLPEPKGHHRVFLDFEEQLLNGGGAGRVVCVSDLVRRELIERYPACTARTVVVPNGVDLDRFHPRNRDEANARVRRDLDVDEGTPLVAFLAHDPALKGLPTLYRALADLSDKPWCLVVAGPRHPRPWQKEAARAGLPSERVRVREQLDAPTLLAAADLAVLPTFRDTSSLVLLESLASGTPVITTTRAGAATLVNDPRAGTVLPEAGDQRTLGMALELWLDLVAAAPPDREVVRASVEGHGLAPWLDTLERLIAEFGSPA